MKSNKGLFQPPSRTTMMTRGMTSGIPNQDAGRVKCDKWDVDFSHVWGSQASQNLGLKGPVFIWNITSKGIRWEPLSRWFRAVATHQPPCWTKLNAERNAEREKIQSWRNLGRPFQTIWRRREAADSWRRNSTRRLAETGTWTNFQRRFAPIHVSTDSEHPFEEELEIIRH